MALKHNKKRNSGLLVEFFSRYIAECMVSWNHDKIEPAKNIWKKHVKEGSEIQKEIQLFRSLYETKLQNEEVALELIKAARHSAQGINHRVLEREKTELIKDVQKEIKSPKFFDASVDDYTTYATIQILLNSWIEKPLTEGVINPAISELQDRVLTHMLKERNNEPSSDPSTSSFFKMTEDDVDSLVVNIMTEKMNKKFDDLSEEQKTILRQFIFGSNKTELVQVLESLNKETRLLIDRENLKKKSNKKLTEVRQMLDEDFRDVSEPDEKCITFYLTVSKLCEELKEENGN